MVLSARLSPAGLLKFEARFRVPFAEGDYAGYVAKVFVWDGDSLTTTNGIPLSDVTILDQ